MKDMRGVEIERGDTVVHTTRYGMCVGIVTEVEPQRISVSYEDGHKGKPYISAYIVVVNGVPDAENQA